jgi:hypothetical protein
MRWLRRSRPARLAVAAIRWQLRAIWRGKFSETLRAEWIDQTALKLIVDFGE